MTEPRHVRTRTEINLGDVALVIIAIFVVLAFFNGWG